MTKDVKTLVIQNAGNFRELVKKTKPLDAFTGHFPTLLDVVELYNLGNPGLLFRKKKIFRKLARDSLIPKSDPMLGKIRFKQRRNQGTY
ncbi:hypothetical protein ACFFWB_27405 [Flavobacterium procerum]|uniref:hypothetical protein n=1 Tax=Flavobacterium procerum TaxID=1455569 RepID=UPI0035EA2426